MATAQLEIAEATEEELIERWRYEQIRQAGYDAPTASELAERTDVDLHLAVELLHHSCPQDLALRILR